LVEFFKFVVIVGAVAWGAAFFRLLWLVGSWIEVVVREYGE